MTESYKCPNCMAALSYDADTEMLKCEHCGGSCTPETALPENNSWDMSGRENWGEGELSVYCCPSCGAELMCHPNTAATFCPYCGNHAVIQGKFEAGIKPEYIIPFKYTRQQAEKRLMEHFSDRTNLPRKFRKEGVIEDVHGVYLPFWLLDGRVWGKFRYEGQISMEKSNYKGDVTITRLYRVSRNGNMRFEKIPVDASSRMPDKYMDSIEPYDYRGLRKFSFGYLAGFYADKYDVSPEECEKKAMELCKASLRLEIEKTLSCYDSFTPQEEEIGVGKGEVHGALFPVWLMSVRWRGKRRLYAVNGQTGKTAGEVPVAYGRIFGAFLGICSAVCALGTAITWLIVH